MDTYTDLKMASNIQNMFNLFHDLYNTYKNQEDKIFPLDLWKVKNSTFSEDEGK